MSEAVPSRLEERIREADSDAVIEALLEWSLDQDLELYPAQEEALLEIASGKHVILSTPTGSGKSLVALGMHFKSLCSNERSFYTAPIKALVSEKFFALCKELGAENVGMLTGDASINARAPVICCTAEILSNIALREGRHAKVDTVVMDEFHYYADRDRGVAWQIPLLELADATFLLMSATLGDMTNIADDLARRTGREVATVTSKDRPVPLDYSYRELPLHQTVQELNDKGLAPVYLVNFTQREAAENAQNLTSLNVTSKEEKRTILDALRGFRFDTPYGRGIQRLVRQGVGLHHAGILPKYRLLVEQLAQQGLLKIISGTDTLGVGVNIPIRTVLFSRLYKFDGEKTGLLSARDFHQVAGRAGRKGFDEAGSVVCLAPEHVIENRSAEAKAQSGKQKRKAKKRPPPKGFVHYDATTFLKLIESPPEPLRSQFKVDTNTLMSALERMPTIDKRDGGYRRVLDLIDRCHESARSRHRHRRQAAQVFRTLRTVGVIELAEVDWSPHRHVHIKEELQKEFSLFQSLSLFLVEALFRLDPATETYAYDVISFAEATLENPRVILLRQLDRAKGDLIAQLKAEGVDYSERMDRLEDVDIPKPCAEFLYQVFDEFRESHPWMRQDNVRPKSIVRDMHERYCSFNDYVKEYGLERSEGVLLRYLSQAYKALVQTVPDSYKDDDVEDIIAWLRTVLGHVDASLVSEWESMLNPVELDGPEALQAGPPRIDISKDTRRFFARIRAEMHQLVKALADQNYEEALLAVRQEVDAEGAVIDEDGWPAERFEASLASFYEDYERIIFDARARNTDLTRISKEGPEGDRMWRISHTLLDPNEDNMWYLEGVIDLSDPDASTEGPLIQLERIDR